MSGNDESGGNRTVFRPSPLQNLKDQASQRDAPAAALPSLRENDVPEPPVAAAPRNRILVASARLLGLLASVRSGRAGVPLPKLHGQALAAINQIDRELNGAYPDETLRRVRYALCVTADDVALNLPDSPQDSAEWARRALAAHFFGETIGGDRFWSLLDEMVGRPVENQDLLELYHACLASGFEGRYRVVADGRRLHQETMQRVFQALEAPRTVSAGELSPHWRGAPAAEGRVGFWTPIAAAAAAAAAVLLVIYILLRVILAATGAPAMDALAHINPSEPLTLSRVAPPPPPPPVSDQAAQLRVFLAEQIAQHRVSVVEDPRTVRVRTTIGQLFKPGSDQLEPGQVALFGEIAQAIEKAGKADAGPVVVEGFTDDTPIHNASFSDNTGLSEARARAVADLIRTRLSRPQAVESRGYGDAQPLATNDTTEGRSQNRRVEIVVQRRAN